MLAQLKSLFRQKTNKHKKERQQQQQPQQQGRGSRYRPDNKVKVIDYTSNLQPICSIKKKPTTSEEEQERIKTAERAQRLIEQEKQRKARLPMYVGLERYEIIKKLGDGAFSNVYKGRDTMTGRRVAIKVVRKPDAETENQNHLHPNMKQRPRATERANILKEVQIMRNIRHPNVVQLIQFTESKENYFLVMELCDGGELFHRIVKLTYFSEPLSRHVITQVAYGVRHLHEVCGVVHRDIKPENILFDSIPFIPTPPQQRVRHAFDQNKEDEGMFIKDVGGGGIGTVKLADFGLSKQIWNNSTFTPCGTVGYTAPEIVRDQRYSKSVDMWAIGCVLYTMLCGFPPFYDESIHALTEKVARGQYAFLSPWWDPISDAAKDLITHLLCVDPNERYTVDQFLAHPWVTEEPFVKQESNTELLQSNVNSNATPSTLAPTASSLSTDASSLGRRDVFSPGVPTLKEILDVTYAVQRMGEEKSFRREKARASASNSNNIPGTATAAATTSKSTTTNNKDCNNHMHSKSKLAPFELSLDNATLLKNRRAHQAAPVPKIC